MDNINIGMCVCVYFLDVIVWLSHSANISKKGMNPTILPPVMGKL